MVADRHGALFYWGFFSPSFCCSGGPQKEVDAGVSNPSRAPEADMTGLCVVRGDAQPCFLDV
jgi:hypothetical protein